MEDSAKGDTRVTKLRFSQIELSKNNNIGFSCEDRAAKLFISLFTFLAFNNLGGVLGNIMYKP